MLKEPFFVKSRSDSHISEQNIFLLSSPFSGILMHNNKSIRIIKKRVALGVAATAIITYFRGEERERETKARGKCIKIVNHTKRTTMNSTCECE